MKAAIFIFWAFLILSLPASHASACECDPPKAQKLFSDAKAVFVGQVIDINESTIPLGKGFPPLSYAVKFKVSRYWKGVKGAEITVHSDLGGLPCQQFAYRKGETYLVYAFGKDLISITGCTRSGSIDADYVVEQLKLFGKGKVPKEIEARGNNTAPHNNSLDRTRNHLSLILGEDCSPVNSGVRELRLKENILDLCE